MKRKCIGSIGAVLAVVLILPFQAHAAGAKATVETQINKILETMQQPGFKDQSRDAQIVEVRKIINKVFDYKELSRRTLGREWRKFKPEQRKEFIDLFSRLLENVYADRVLAYTHEKIEYGRETVLKKGRVEVESFIITVDNKKVPLFYRMIQKNGQWHVYDVVIEGVSMIKNYRGQFRQILSKEKPEDLLQTLREKVKEEPAS